MKNKTLKFGWPILLSGLFMLGAFHPAFAGTERDTTKIPQCIKESAAPQFITCDDASMLIK